MTALKARPYEPDPPKPVERDFMLLVRGMLDQNTPDWPEIRSAARGLDISGCHFKGLQRDLGTATDPSGGYLQKTSQPRTFFDSMIAASVLGRAGARVMEPRGDWSAIPVVATVGELSWIDPNAGPINETPMTFGSRPRTTRLGVFSVDITRALRIPAGGLVERVVLSEGARVCGAGLDKVALVGTGLNNQPLGILNCPITSTSGAAFSATTAAELLRTVEAANGIPGAFIVSPVVAKLLRTRPRFSTSDTPLLSGGKISDVATLISMAMPDDQVLLGDFSRLTVCAESIQLLINPYVQSTVGTVEITFYLFADVVIEHPAAFCAATGVS